MRRALVVILFFVACKAPGRRPSAVARAEAAPVAGDTATLVGAGDIAECESPGDEETAALLDSIPGTVFTVGDNAYADGAAQDFSRCYAPSWGRHKARTRPSPGNHDYHSHDAGPYFAYFGAQAGVPGRGYYSYDLGAWHLISLNSNIRMSRGSDQEKWLRADLAASRARCVLAYWHSPRFSSSDGHADDPKTAPLWQALYDFGAEIVLAGHDHDYERFAPQTPDGRADPERGIREFVVGTGGAERYGFGTPHANSEIRNGDTWGVLRLTLLPDRYHWDFVPVKGATFSDSGSGRCH